MSCRGFFKLGSRPDGQPDEKGAMLALAAVGLVVAMIAAGLAVDIGRIASYARTDQKVADLAAMDALRTLSTSAASGPLTTAALASAGRNGFPTSAGYSVSAVEGLKVGNTCTASAGAGSVCVTVTSPHTNMFPFLGGRTSVTRAAVASNTAYAGFSIGSSLVTLDTSRSTLLNSFLGGMLKGSALSLSLVSWQGLAAGDLTLSALQTQLASMGFSVGTVSQLLSTNLTVSQLLQAEINALNAQGGSSATVATILGTIKAATTNTTQFNLGQLIHVSQGADNTALASELNVFQLLTGSAELANGSNFIDIPGLNFSVPSVTSTEVKLQVIQPPQWYYGPVGGSVSTAQISLTVTPTLNLSLPVTLGLNIATIGVTSAYPVKVTAGGAVGTLTAATCGASPGISVLVDPSAFSGSISASLDATVTLLGINVATVNIPETSVVPSTDGGAGTLSFSYPSQFPPPLGTETSKHWGSQPIGLSGLTQITAGTATVTVGTLPIGLSLGTVVSTVLGALPGVLANVDNLVLTPLLQTLGVDIGSADVTARALTCGVPSLNG